jgi:hypothetical protein
VIKKNQSLVVIKLAQVQYYYIFFVFKHKWVKLSSLSTICFRSILGLYKERMTEFAKEKIQFGFDGVNKYKY